MTPDLLIVTADDYGLTEGVSLGILEAHHRGIVTSTSVLALGPALDRTASLLADSGELGVGAHLAAVGEDPPLLSAREIPTLVDRRGRLAPSWRSFVRRAAAGRIDADDLRREFDAQAERVAGLGVPLTHVDAHQHLHLWPPVGDVVIGIAQRRAIPALRVPRSRAGRAVGRAVNRLARRLAQRASAAGLRFPASFAGLDESGRISTSMLEQMVGRLAAEGASSAELCCHPGSPHDPERERYRWGYRWAEELEALCSARAAQAVARGGFHLGTPASLAPVSRRPW
ncbi:MAG: ChbG/HpnK family deacetylase [Actinomycetota bacterium]